MTDDDDPNVAQCTEIERSTGERCEAEVDEGYEGREGYEPGDLQLCWKHHLVRETVQRVERQSKLRPERGRAGDPEGVEPMAQCIATVRSGSDEYGNHVYERCEQEAIEDSSLGHLCDTHHHQEVEARALPEMCERNGCRQPRRMGAGDFRLCQRHQRRLSAVTAGVLILILVVFGIYAANPDSGASDGGCTHGAPWLCDDPP